jgi:GH15 family glucan-1,4-alpha-glucosidase
VAAVERELTDGPLVYRYTGMRDEEGAFVACSFWLVSALACLGRPDEAAERMTAAVGLANDVGVLSEQMAADGHSALGNLPQALSHLALINAAALLT